jgi:hypothetical protein
MRQVSTHIPIQNGCGGAVNELQSESFANFEHICHVISVLTVIRSCPKAIFNKLWDQFPATDVRYYNFQQNRSTPKYLVSTAEISFTSQKNLCGKYWR